MARPRVVRTADGAEVVMRNLAPEMADKVKALLSGEDSADESMETVAAPVSSVDVSTLRNTAIGTFLDGTDLKWKLAVVKFNGSTKEASVEQIITAGLEKTEASEKFKIQAVSMGLVV